MATTKGRSGFGALLKLGDGGGPEVFSTVAEMVDITPPETTLDTDDATHNESPLGFAEKVATVLRAGDAQATINFLPDDASQIAMRTAQSAKRLANYQITIPGSTKMVRFAAFVGSLSPSFPHSGKMVNQIRLAVSGPVEIS